MTETEKLLIEAKALARKHLGADVSAEVVAQILDVLVLERGPGSGERQTKEERTLH